MSQEQQQTHQSKVERLQEVAKEMVGSLPAMVRPLASNYMGLFTQLEESDIDKFVDRVQGLIRYVETGER